MVPRSNRNPRRIPLREKERHRSRTRPSTARLLESVRERTDTRNSNCGAGAVLQQGGREEDQGSGRDSGAGCMIVLEMRGERLILFRKSEEARKGFLFLLARSATDNDSHSMLESPMLAKTTKSDKPDSMYLDYIQMRYYC